MNSRSSNKKLAIGICVLAVVALVTAIAIRNRPEPSSPNTLTYRLGVMLPQSGKLAFIGDPMEGALRLAQEAQYQRLSSKGVEIQLVWADTKGNPAEAATALNRLIDVNGVDGIIATLSGVVDTVYPRTEEHDLLFIGLTVDPSFLTNSRHAIRVFFSFRREGQLLVEAVARDGWNKALLFYSTDAATSFEVEEILIPDLRARGIEVVAETFSVGQRDFRDIVSKHARFDGSGVIVHGFGSELPHLIEDIDVQPTLKTLPRYGSLGCLDVQTGLQSRMKGVKFFAPQFAAADPSPEFARFKRDFQERFPDTTFTYSAVYAYDAYVLLAEALLQARTRNSAKIKASLETPTHALSETYTFTPEGDYAPATVLMVFGDDGTIQPQGGRP